MIASVFIFLAFVIFITAILYFLFLVFIPSLKNENFSILNAVFSKEEEKFSKREMNFFDEADEKIAVVKSFEKENEEDEKLRFKYNGIADCSIFWETYGTKYFVEKGCIGFGSCAKKCLRNAISIQNGKAVVGIECNGCGKCVSVCPKNLISLVDKNQSDSSQMDLTPKNKKLFQMYTKYTRMLKD